MASPEDMKTLICNAGSSSLKFSLFETRSEQLLAEGTIDWVIKPARLSFRCAGQPEIREELANLSTPKEKQSP
jgi:acetate kinase